MGNPSADAFLSCVMRRNRSDIIIRLGSLFLIVFGIPLLVGIFISALDVREVEEDIELLIPIIESITGIILFCGVLDAYVLYMMVYAHYKHHGRDIVWLRSLTGYAESYGKDTSELKAIEESFSASRIDVGWKIAAVFFVFILISHTAMAIMLSTSTIEESFADEVSYVTSISMLVGISVGSAYVFVSVRKDDNLQCDYTVKWTALMKDEMPCAEPMATGIKRRRVWPHIVVMIATIGIYSLIFALWVIHAMNLHISRQNTYEESVLKWIMEKEGAKGIEGVEEDMGEGLVNLALRMFT